MKYALQQIKETKRAIKNTNDMLKRELKKALGGKYLISIHYHYSVPVVSIWHDDDEFENAPSYTLYDDHFKVRENGDYAREAAHDAIEKIFYPHPSDNVGDPHD